MIDRLQTVLDQMDGWLAQSSSGETTPLSRDELIQWHIALTTLHERLVELQEASQAAVDAFLLRPSKAEPPSTRPGGSPGRTGQKLYQRLAEAMADLERVLVQLKASSGQDVEDAE